MVVEHRPTGTVVIEPPVLVVEVLSPSTRLEDTVRKSPEYVAGGVRQFWVLDPEARYLDVFDLGDGGWGDDHLHLDEDTPVGQVVVPGHGTVPVDLRDLLPF